MKREIKFRGKPLGRYAHLEWIEGYYTGGDRPRIYGLDGVCSYDVDPETVCQDTGAKDKTGKEIYEGDVLKLIFKDKYSDLEMEGVVKFCQDHLSFNCFDGTYPWGSPLGKWNISQMEIIGNVFDNPEYKERFGRVFEDET